MPPNFVVLDATLPDVTRLVAHEGVILFCTATGVSHAAVGITTHAMQSMAIKGCIVHDRESGAYALKGPLCLPFEQVKEFGT